MIERLLVLEKLTQYLNSEISRTDVHSWALSVAVAREFDQQADPLVTMTVHSLIDINHDNLKMIPSRRALEYYRLCLEGKIEFDPEHADLDQITMLDEELPDLPPDLSPEKVVAEKEKRRYRTIFRVYVFLFGICSLLLHFIALLKPDLLLFNKAASSAPAGLTVKSLPHVLYAIMVLLPMGVLARGRAFYVALPSFVLGMLYYWYISIAIIGGLSIHMIFVLVMLPFGAVPATMALWLLLMHRQDMNKEITS